MAKDKDNQEHKQKHSREEDTSKVRDTLMRLSEMCDLIGLRTHIIEGTSRGRKLKPDPWHNTKDYMSHYADPGNTEALISEFQSAGCPDEIQAIRWLLKHDALVP